MKSTYRQERKSWKVDLHHPANITLELFTFENAPERPSYPEAIGLRHLAFSVVNIEDVVQKIISKGIQVESIRTDLITGKRFTFLQTLMICPLNYMKYKKISRIILFQSISIC